MTVSLQRTIAQTPDDKITTSIYNSDMVSVENLINKICPAGTILSYGGTTAPELFLLCDGTSYLRTSYPQLFYIIGTAYGTVDSTHFNVPDFRGRFLRGTANGQTTDPDRASRTAMATGGNTGDNIGSIQGDVMQGHYHSTTATKQLSGLGASSNKDYISAANPEAGWFYPQNITSPSTDGVNGTPRTSSETRPLNAYVNYIIKY